MLCNEVFEKEIFWGFSVTGAGTLNFMDRDGMIISRHRIRSLDGVWKEDHQIYGAAADMGNPDTLNVFLFQDMSD